MRHHDRREPRKHHELIKCDSFALLADAIQIMPLEGEWEPSEINEVRSHQPPDVSVKRAPSEGDDSTRTPQSLYAVEAGLLRCVPKK